MNKKEEFEKHLAPIGFQLTAITENGLEAKAKGISKTIYLSLHFGRFSVGIMHEFLSNQLFYWQHFDSYEEIANLLRKNQFIAEELHGATPIDWSDEENQDAL